MTLEEARAALEAALAGLRRQGDEALVAGTYAQVVKVAGMCSSKGDAFKLCREYLGMIPHEVAS